MTSRRTWSRSKRREAERILGEQIDAIPELQGLQPRAQVVEGDPFDGILRAAASTGADLIVMGAHRKQLLRDILVGTTIERVIRMGPSPVLMVNKEVDQPYRTALAAVDLSEPSVNAIRTGTGIGAARGRPARARSCLPAAGERADVLCRTQPGNHRRVRGR